MTGSATGFLSRRCLAAPKSQSISTTLKLRDVQPLPAQTIMTKQRFARLSLVAALVLGAATAAAQHIRADFAGSWSVLVEGPQGPMSSEFALVQKGDTVAGEFISEIGRAPVAGLAKGDSLKLLISLDMGGQQLALTVSGALKDKDNLTGTVDAAGMGAFPFTAARKK